MINVVLGVFLGPLGERGSAISYMYGSERVPNEYETEDIGPDAVRTRLRLTQKTNSEVLYHSPPSLHCCQIRPVIPRPSPLVVRQVKEGVKWSRYPKIPENFPNQGNAGGKN